MHTPERLTPWFVSATALAVGLLIMASTPARTSHSLAAPALSADPSRYAADETSASDLPWTK